MAISQLLADNLLVRLIRGDAGRADLVLSMAGVKLGERLLVLGLADASVLATLGAKVGITGRACGIDSEAAPVERAGRRAERAGVLVEVAQSSFAELPYASDSFDLVVARPLGALGEPSTLRRALGAAARVLRDGGRCLVLADSGRRGVAAWMRAGRAPRLSGAQIVQWLADDGYRGPRVLADREGRLFVEAIHRH